ncbi:VOC family protein [Oryzobacter sp. R7]|uniref:VOC family protein n=1 Tax=Oryzobacter faecalis TaxID=3388656 RepID=UPI00398CC6C5
MASTMNPYLNFPGTARDAMTFYQGVLGGDLVVNTFGEYGAEGPAADGVMHAQLTTPDGFTLMASDMPPGQEDTHNPGNAITVSLSGDDESLRRYWEGLSDGATVTMPLEKQMWGDEFGALVDRFGVPWMVNIAGGGGGGADSEG